MRGKDTRFRRCFASYFFGTIQTLRTSISHLQKVELWTDGSCLKNPGGPGGWAALLRMDGNERMLSGGHPATTNNIMELTGPIRGFEAIGEPSTVTVYCDSQYVVNGFAKSWVANWRSNGWITSAGKPVKNRLLWEELFILSSRHLVTWKWVRGHVGLALNERVDEEAGIQARRASSSRPLELAGHLR